MRPLMKMRSTSPIKGQVTNADGGRQIGLADMDPEDLEELLSRTGRSGSPATRAGQRWMSASMRLRPSCPQRASAVRCSPRRRDAPWVSRARQGERRARRARPGCPAGNGSGPAPGLTGPPSARRRRTAGYGCTRSGRPGSRSGTRCAAVRRCPGRSTSTRCGSTGRRPGPGALIYGSRTS